MLALCFPLDMLSPSSLVWLGWGGTAAGGGPLLLWHQTPGAQPLTFWNNPIDCEYRSDLHQPPLSGWGCINPFQAGF